MQDLTAQVEQATSDREEKSVFKANKLQAKADANGELRDTKATKQADEKYLADLEATCSQKSADFQSRQQLRSEEIEAISKAIEIMSSGKVSGHADTHLPALMQKGRSFAQLRNHGAAKGSRARAAAFLTSRASMLNSRMLSGLSEKVRDDPFEKVKTMIKDLIVRLMEEANEEAEHKGWCDTELATNEQTRKEKTQSVETLHAEIDELQASIAKLTEDVAELTAAVAKLVADMAEQTKLRQEEKATNAK